MLKSQSGLVFRAKEILASEEVNGDLRDLAEGYLALFDRVQDLQAELAEASRQLAAVQPESDVAEVG